MKPRSAVILVESAGSQDAASLGRLLDFFGVSHRTIFADNASDKDVEWINAPEQEVALIASATGFILAKKNKLIDNKSIHSGQAWFQTALVYAGMSKKDMLAAYALLFDSRPCQIVPHTADRIKIRISDKYADLCGPFSGLTIENVHSTGIIGLVIGNETSVPVIMSHSQSNAAVLLNGLGTKNRYYLSVSPLVLNIDTVTKAKFFDIKVHLLELLPFILYVKNAFAGSISETDGVKACVIVDDPTLVRTYGYFDYADILSKMRTKGFTTNVSFIPWNYRRSDPAVVNLVESNSDRISISVHGCDHTKAEFGATAENHLDWLARTATVRMDLHKARHHLEYDKVMIFPQGVFSAESAIALKLNYYWAAVNTDICAINDQTGVPFAEVMDLAITKYGSFPIVTRRYLWHGLENFAFDILLGKPCLIVTHHQDYKNGASELLSGLDALEGLNANLRWVPLGNIVQTLYKRQSGGGESQSIRIYSSSSFIKNHSQSPIEATISKLETNVELLDCMLVNGKPGVWTCTNGLCRVRSKIKSGETIHLQFKYKQHSSLPPFKASFVRSSEVMLRRYLTEIRDRFLS